MAVWTFEDYLKQPVEPVTAHPSCVIGFVHGASVVKYQHTATTIHQGDVLRMLVRYYHSMKAIEQLKLYCERHGHFTLRPRVSLITDAKTSRIADIPASSWENGTGLMGHEQVAGRLGSIFFHNGVEWVLRHGGVRDKWFPAAPLFSERLKWNEQLV